MMIATVLFLVVMITCIYLYRGKVRNTRSNHYHKHKAPELRTTTEQLTQEQADYEDTDEALGIRIIEKKPAEQTPIKANLSPQSDCLVALYLMAPEGTVYSGYELLQALLSSGMRYGKQRIFNRHEHKDGRGAILFHCASATSPGTFDLTKMGAFSCKGLCLFFKASAVEDPLSTFDCLLETVDQLVEDIGGQVLDENRALFTKDRMVKYRQQIRAFENGKVTADLFE